MISASWCLSIGLFMINKNTSIPPMDNNSAIMDIISVFQISHNFSNLNLIVFHAIQSYKNILFLFFSHATFNLSLIFWGLKSKLIIWTDLLSLIVKDCYTFIDIRFVFFMIIFIYHIYTLEITSQGQQWQRCSA